MKVAIALLVVLLSPLSIASEVSMYGQISVHDAKRDDVKWHSPIGTYGLKLENDDKSVFCEHMSSIPDIDDKPGLNHCGFEMKIKLFD